MFLQSVKYFSKVFIPLTGRGGGSGPIISNTAVRFLQINLSKKFLEIRNKKTVF